MHSDLLKTKIDFFFMLYITYINVRNYNFIGIYKICLEKEKSVNVISSVPPTFSTINRVYNNFFDNFCFSFIVKTTIHEVHTQLKENIFNKSHNLLNYYLLFLFNE